MRLSKVAKELNVGIANIVDHLASKGVKVDARPNTKITQDAYEILKQQFIADVEQHKRSTEVAQARREEKQAIKDAATKKIEKTPEVVKAKADISGPKMVGKIEVSQTPKTESKENSVKSIAEFRLELIQDELSDATDDEILFLKIDSEEIRIREVILYGNENPMVFARTIIPNITIEKGLRELGKIGNKPLGDILFEKDIFSKEGIVFATFKTSLSNFDF